MKYEAFLDLMALMVVLAIISIPIACGELYEYTQCHQKHPGLKTHFSAIVGCQVEVRGKLVPANSIPNEVVLK